MYVAHILFCFVLTIARTAHHWGRLRGVCRVRNPRMYSLHLLIDYRAGRGYKCAARLLTSPLEKWVELHDVSSLRGRRL